MSNHRQCCEQATWKKAQEQISNVPIFLKRLSDVKMVDRTCGIGMCTDTCVNMCIDMCMDMCVNMCTDMYVYRQSIGLCMDMCVSMCIGRDI